MHVVSVSVHGILPKLITLDNNQDTKHVLSSC